MKPNLNCRCTGHGALQPVALAERLLAAECTDCGGLLLAMDDWRAWHASAPPAPGSIDEVIEIFDTATARHCPECDRLMQRLRVSAGQDFRIDRCTHCQNLWFDRGEWPALVARGLTDRLDELLSDRWQRQLQTEEVRTARVAALRQRYGDDCIDELERFRSWLDTQPHRDELLALLRAG